MDMDSIPRAQKLVIFPDILAAILNFHQIGFLKSEFNHRFVTSDPENHRKDILHAMYQVRHTWKLETSIFPAILAAILDFRHIGFLKLIITHKFVTSDPENPTKDILHAMYLEVNNFYPEICHFSRQFGRHLGKWRRTRVEHTFF